MIATSDKRAKLGVNKKKDLGASDQEDSSSGEEIEVVPKRWKKHAKRGKFDTESDEYDY